MGKLTFGFLDPSRGANQNHDLGARLRDQAIKSFKAQTVCDLSHIASLSMDDLQNALLVRVGAAARRLRDSYYDSLSERKASIRLPDIQSFFLYSFTLGLNLAWLGLTKTDDIGDPKPFSSKDVLNRHFLIRGPDWVRNAANRKMPHVENVFCDFQNELFLPLMRSPSPDYRLLADAIAGSFLWSVVAGFCWLKKTIEDIRKCISRAGGNSGSAGIAMYQVRKSMESISDEDVELALNTPTPGTLPH